MKLKTIEVEGKTFAEINDGKPVYVDDAGKEHSYDAPAMRGSLDKLNSVLGDERSKLSALQEQVQQFDGLDPDQARKALKTLGDIDSKKLIDAGEIEKVRAQIAEGYEKKLSTVTDELKTLEGRYATEKVNGAFANSKFVKDRLAIPADMVQAAFARHFQFEGGSIKPVDAHGNAIYSESNPAELASFDEALERIVGQYPNRDAIMKGTGSNGSGTGPVDQGGSRSRISRADFDALPPAQQHAIATKGEVQITD